MLKEQSKKINPVFRSIIRSIERMLNKNQREMHLITYYAIAHTGACIRPQPLNALNFNVKHNQLC